VHGSATGRASIRREEAFVGPTDVVPSFLRPRRRRQATPLEEPRCPPSPAAAALAPRRAASASRSPAPRPRSPTRSPGQGRRGGQPGQGRRLGKRSRGRGEEPVPGRRRRDHHRAEAPGRRSWAWMGRPKEGGAVVGEAGDGAAGDGFRQLKCPWP
jgi:hypothetical protein